MSNRLPRILIADDEADHIKLIRLHLSQYPVRVAEACDGNEALRKYLVAAAIGDPYDLLILDGVMPGKNGFQVAEEIREGDADTKIAFLTADHTGVAPMRASLINCVAFWRKPLADIGGNTVGHVAREIAEIVRVK